jgi:hypothetical protein
VASSVRLSVLTDMGIPPYVGLVLAAAQDALSVDPSRP